ncbi:MAG: hypothetical protein IPO36_10915 [Anaerolineales bacterium]|nr:hypothetical protein [Anaerolineales bacterium]
MDVTFKGICLEYDNNGVFIGTNRPIYLGGADLDENTLADNLHDPTTLGASNIGGTLNYANDVLEQSARNDASLIVILLDSGPANATSIDDALNYPDGFCPQNTWNKQAPLTPNCRDNDLAAYPFRHLLITRTLWEPKL